MASFFYLIASVKALSLAEFPILGTREEYNQIRNLEGHCSAHNSDVLHTFLLNFICYVYK